MNRDEMRAAIFAAENKRPKSKIITLFGQKIEVRQPTVAQVQNVAENARGRSAIVSLMIEYCYMPDSGDPGVKVFDPADYEGMLGFPTGKWLTDFNTAVEELSGVDVQAAVKSVEEGSSEDGDVGSGGSVQHSAERAVAAPDNA